MGAPEARTCTTVGSLTYHTAGPGDPTCWAVALGLEPTKWLPGALWCKVAGQRAWIYMAAGLGTQTKSDLQLLHIVNSKAGNREGVAAAATQFDRRPVLMESCDASTIHEGIITHKCRDRYSI